MNNRDYPMFACITESTVKGLESVFFAPFSKFPGSSSEELAQFVHRTVMLLEPGYVSNVDECQERDHDEDVQ